MKKIVLYIMLFHSYVICSSESQTSHLYWDFDYQNTFLDQCPAIGSKEKSKVIISAPTPKGKMKKFLMYKTSVMPIELSNRFPSILTYSGIGVEDASERISITKSFNKVQAMILGKDGNIFVSQINNDGMFRVSYLEEDVYKDNIFNSCGLMSTKSNNALYRQNTFDSCIGEENPCFTMGNELVTYRLAVIMTEAVTNSKADGTVEGGMAWLSSMVNQLNILWLRELGFQLELISNNDILIFTDNNPSPKGEDGFGDTNCSNPDPKYCEINNVEPYLDSVIGVGGLNAPDDQRLWEYGMVLNTTYNGGVAQSPGPISASNPDYEVINHELGHNLGSAHNITIENGYRCSLGGTIMGSRTRTSLPSKGDQYSSHTIEIAFKNFNELPVDVAYGDSYAYLKGSTRVETDNVVPDLNVPESGFSIPKETPFVLEGTATPHNSNYLYSWEQNDISSISFCMDLSSTSDECSGLSSWPSTEGPLFSTVDLSNSGNKRYFPDLISLLGNQYSTTFDDYGNVLTVERLPFGSREINMRLQVRTNEINGGAINFKNVMFSVDGNSGPFRITSQTDPVNWEVESIQTITWDVSNTDSYPVNCSKVDILLSTDGGLNYDIVLAEKANNDGSHEVEVPLIATASNCRIMVKASNNIFFDINNSFFSILNSKAPSISFADDSIYIESSANTQFETEIVIENSGEIGSVLAYDIYFVDSTYMNEDFEGLEISSLSTDEFMLPQNWERTSNGRGWIIGTEEKSAWPFEMDDFYFDIPNWSDNNYAYTDDGQYNICPTCISSLDCSTINGCTDGSLDYLITPEFYIPTTSNATLSFNSFSFYESYFDHNNTLQIEIDNEWLDIETLDHNQNEFVSKQYDLENYSGKDVKFRFHSESGEPATWNAGWALDNVVLQTSPNWIFSSELNGILLSGEDLSIPISINTANLSINGNYNTKIIVEDKVNNVSKSAMLSLNIIEGSDLSVDAAALPKEYVLKSPYPNPFNPITNIDYGLPHYSQIKVEVYDLAGKKISTLENTYKYPGFYSLVWNATNYPSGIYFIKLESNGSNISTKKIMLLK